MVSGSPFIIMSADKDTATCRLHNATDRIDKSCFASTVRAEKGKDFTALYFQINSRKSFKPVLERFVQR